MLQSADVIESVTAVIIVSLYMYTNCCWVDVARVLDTADGKWNVINSLRTAALVTDLCGFG